MSGRDLHAEIETLRREVAALRTERAGAGAAETRRDGLVDQLQLLAKELTNLTEDIEQTLTTHPLTSIVGALALGMVIGRLIRS